ncbi:hypothetical protein O2V63_12460 [Modestobacter sp. VKM Ac-2977]|uniref:hypothetical protein n=1 Tax=Modestobacter sp. VKM Ac-2977 TaxID=3004131 RepID=UPI0022AB161F|nr:hypothetical protein [Modestobacter sp. VKM Ac-2977]MCZ2821147.1 hypothetical protein [Modestobacter sp. VKM Ac-2977]
MPESADPRRSRAPRRRTTAGAVLCAPVGLLVALLPAGSAAADDGTAPYGEPTTRCEITDPRLPELSGLASAGESMLAMNDGGDRAEVLVLDGACAVGEVRTAEVDPYDPEDLALAADGTIWLADIGDNAQSRETVALIGLRPDGTTVLTRLTYPDGPHDAEALLLAPDGTPYLVTKEVLGASSVYRPDAPLADGATVPMSKVAALGLTLTGTPGGPVGRAGQLLVTGGAVSSDGSRIALRTYTDAYVWPLSGSDVVGALAGPPVRVALPEAPQGEAIAFAANDRDLLVAGEGLPAVVTQVPAAGDLTGTAPAEPTEAADGSLATAGGVEPLTAGLIAAAVATVLVWAGGKLRRSPA